MSWPGVVLLMALETVIFLIPSEAVMPLAGWMLIKDKGLGIEWILIAGILGGLGSTAGSIVLYYVGALGGRPILERYGKYLFIRADEIDQADRFFEKWGPWTVFFGRMIPLVRSLISIPAGVSRMDIRIFTLSTFAGSAIWAALLAAVGFALGENWEDIRDWMGPLDIVIAAIVGAFGIWYVYRHVKKAWEVRPTSDPEA